MPLALFGNGIREREEEAAILLMLVQSNYCNCCCPLLLSSLQNVERSAVKKVPFYLHCSWQSWQAATVGKLKERNACLPITTTKAEEVGMCALVLCLFGKRERTPTQRCQAFG